MFFRQNYGMGLPPEFRLAALINELLVIKLINVYLKCTTDVVCFCIQR